jgi:membrane protein
LHALGGTQAVSVVVQIVVALITAGVVFAVMFRALPDADVRWHDVGLAGAVTALLFVLGQSLLAWFITRFGGTSVYGPAGALVAVLVWIYYSAQIVLFGAALSKAVADRARPILPIECAI